MTRVEFASSIARQTAVKPVDVMGGTIAEVFEQTFLQQPALRGYVLDDQSAVRKHVAVFINSETISDRTTLSDAVEEDDCVYVIQALSGGWRAMAKELFVGTRKGLFVFAQSADHWKLRTTAFLGVQVPMLMFDARDNLLLASLNHGHFGAKMQRSDDAGRSWEEVETPKYPPKPDDIPDVVDPTRNVPIPWSLELIWSLERSAAGTVWCGTIPGGLFRSGDCGQTWQLVRSLWDRPERSHWFGGGYDYPGIHSICLHPSEPQRINLAVSCGGVWVSEDDGESWQCRSNGMRAAYVPPEKAFDPNIQDPHRMVQCANEPDKLWVQHHNGIFRTTDSCDHWIEVEHAEPSAFGFAVAVHPHDPNTAWFAPAISDEDRYPKDGRLVVTRTVDGGAGFETLSAGLPTGDAYDLIYRHALVVDESGSTLAMGSTTGNLWISQNSGESWQCVTTNLPPIFCLRWG